MSEQSSLFIDANPVFGDETDYLRAVEKFNVVAFGILQVFRDESTEPEIETDYIDSLNAYTLALRSGHDVDISTMKARVYYQLGRGGFPATSVFLFTRNFNAYSEALLELIDVERRSPVNAA